MTFLFRIAVPRPAARRLSWQRGGAILEVVSIIGFGCVLLMLLSWVQTVKPEDVTALEALASGTPSAAAILADELKKTPKPTNFQFGAIRSKVNDELVAAASRSVVGRASSTATEQLPGSDLPGVNAPAQPAGHDEASANARDLAEIWKFFWWGIGGVVLVGVVHVGYVEIWQARRGR